MEKLFKELNQNYNFDLEDCERLFEKYDTDKDGFLLKEDIKQLLIDTYKEKEIKLVIDKENIDHYFHLLDKNNVH